MEELNDLLYDDVEAKYLALQKKKKNRKKKKRQRRLLILVILIAVIAVYFYSDISKVNALKVSGNVFYNEEEILKKANLSYDTRYMVMPKWYIEWKLLKDPLIDEVHVEKKLNGSISIKVSEKGMLGYLVENEENYMLMEDGSKTEIDEDRLSTIVDFPLINGFEEKELKQLSKAFFSKKDPVEPEVISMISEIVPYATSYDEHMVKIIMSDGNTIFTSYESIPLLNSYLDTLMELKKDKACLWPYINTGSIQSFYCSTKE